MSILHELLDRKFLWIIPPYPPKSRDVILRGDLLDLELCLFNGTNPVNSSNRNETKHENTKHYDGIWLELQCGDYAAFLERARTNRNIRFMVSELLKHRMGRFLYSQYNHFQISDDNEIMDSTGSLPPNAHVVYGSPADLLTRLQAGVAEKVFLTSPPNPFKRGSLAFPSHAKLAKQIDYPYLRDPILSITTLQLINSKLVEGGILEITSPHNEVEKWMKMKEPQVKSNSPPLSICLVSFISSSNPLFRFCL